MEKIRGSHYFVLALIFICLLAFLVIYRSGFTGKFIGGAVEDSFINLTKEIELNSGFEEGLEAIKIDSIVQEGDRLNISYEFDNSKFIGGDAAVEIWILNENGSEVRRVQDVFDINKEEAIKRVMLVDLSGIPAGRYEINLALSSELENSIKQDFVFSKSLITGNTILEQPKYKMIGYVVFIIIILAGIFFIMRKGSTASED